VVHTVDLLHTTFVTHDTKQFITTRPDDLDLEPGQGIELALDRDGWHDEGRPFTPTSPNSDDVLEFVIKAYPEHDAVTTRLHDLKPGARLRMSKPFGSIEWRGPGTFIAAGAGRSGRAS
jgi:ferredoxin-NADP reductase